MNKLISFIVPCYNSQDYMEKCIEFLALAGNDIEVLVIDDGSIDNTLSIGKELESKYRDIVRVIHQENKGHGGVIQTGIENANGIYLKVVDSDDWINTDDVKRLISCVSQNLKENNDVDLYITNYVYERTYKNSSIPVRYSKYLPQNKVFGWNEMKTFPQNKVFMMHSLMYKTKLLKDCNIKLPEHVFYEDNYFCYFPLPFCKKLYYIDLDLYHYLLGRRGQSCTDDNLYKNYLMQIKVMDLIFNSYKLDTLNTFDSKLRQYMIHACKGMYLITIIFNAGGSQDVKNRKQQYKEMKLRYKKEDKKLYRKLCLYPPIFILRFRPWFIRRALARFAMDIRSKLSL